MRFVYEFMMQMQRTVVTPAEGEWRANMEEVFHLD